MRLPARSLIVSETVTGSHAREGSFTSTTPELNASQSRPIPGPRIGIDPSELRFLTVMYAHELGTQARTCTGLAESARTWVKSKMTPE
jgi:hypothetical protein